MKRYLFPVMLMAMAAPLLGQDPPPTADPFIMPDPLVALVIKAFAVALMVWKTLDGLKNMFPAIGTNHPNILRIFNALGSFILTAGACLMMGEMNNWFDWAKCIGGAVLAFLMAAGLYEAKKRSDEARAGGASNLANVKAAVAVAEGKNGGHKK